MKYGNNHIVTISWIPLLSHAKLKACKHHNVKIGPKDHIYETLIEHVALEGAWQRVSRLGRLTKITLHPSGRCCNPAPFGAHMSPPSAPSASLNCRISPASLWNCNLLHLPSPISYPWIFQIWCLSWLTVSLTVCVAPCQCRARLERALTVTINALLALE